MRDKSFDSNKTSIERRRKDLINLQDLLRKASDAAQAEEAAIKRDAQFTGA
jgi:hypothetical protein